jgi:carbon monoxide dehydrogenase subunit G
MTRLSASTDTEAIVPADRMAIWAALTDPTLLPKLTPLLQSIDADGDVWTWHMVRISALGVGITPSFTERMTFAEGRRIDYVHEPPHDVTERTGAQGCYELSDADNGTRLKISLTLKVDLPLPRAAAPAVTRVMSRMMRRTGDQFSANLYEHLGIARSTERVGA